MNRNWMHLFIIFAIAKAAGVRGDEVRNDIHTHYNWMLITLTDDIWLLLQSIHSSTRKAYSIESNTSIVKLDEKHDMEKHGMFRHRKQQRVNLFDDSFMSTGDVDENVSVLLILYYTFIRSAISHSSIIYWAALKKLQNQKRQVKEQ